MAGRWPDYLHLLGFNASGFGIKGGCPCPRCGGINRFSLHHDFANNGKAYCRRCFNKKNGDGLALVGWWMGWHFPQVMQAISDYLDGGGPRPAKPRALPPAAEPKPRKRSEPTPAGLSSDFAEWVERSEKLRPALIAFAQQRGVELQSLIAFGVRPNGPNVSFPERWPNGRVSAEVTRFANAKGGNRYRCGVGHKRQFGYALSWLERYPVILIPEGVLDAVALHSAGVDAISRPSLSSDLRPLAKLLAALPRQWQVVVMVENDSPEVMPERIAIVTARAVELATAARRDVSVARYPERLGNDANDCWRAICEEVPNNKIKAGKKLLGEIVKQAEPVEWAGPIIAVNVEEAEQIVETHLAFAGQRRRDEQAREENSACGFFRTHKRHKGDGVQVMSSRMLCSKWICPVCRLRLIDDWFCHLLVEMASLKTVFVGTLRAADDSAIRKLQRAATTRIGRHGGEWAVVNQRPDDAEPASDLSGGREMVVFSSVEIPETGQAFTLASDGMAPLAGYLQSTIALVDFGQSRPISTVRSWSRSEPPSLDDWTTKLHKIISGQGCYRGVTSAAESKAIRKLCRAGGWNYIGLRLPDGQEYIATNMPCTLDTSAPTIIVDDSTLDTADFFASGAWWPRKNKGWEVATACLESGEVIAVNAGPIRLREVAEEFHFKVFDVVPGATSPVSDAAVTRIPESEKNCEENFFSALSKINSFS